jgi:hypothetical protein
MILPKIDGGRFLVLVAFEPLIAFQRLEYGWAVAAQDEAYYAPATHPGGGNLDGDFVTHLGHSFLTRMGKPALRTLRPTAKPLVTVALTNYLGKLAAGEILSFDEAFKKASGDDQAVVDFQTQVVIQAIEEHGRPDLQATMGALKADMMSDALDLVIQHAESARELCEVGHEPQTKVRLHLMQSVQAMKTALEMLLKP